MNEGPFDSEFFDSDFFDTGSDPGIYFIDGNKDVIEIMFEVAE